MLSKLFFTSVFLTLSISAVKATADQFTARELGIKVGVLPAGELNAITDVSGIKIGHVTLIEGDAVRTGVTAILPHGGNLYQDKVPAAVVIGNGYGKFMGYSQIHELGEIETPILLTNTLSVAAAAQGIIDWTLAMNRSARSVNAVVGETNDSRLNDIRGRHVTREHALRAIKRAKSGPVQQGAVGAGTGTVAFGWKGGIGTSSRKLPGELGGFTLGVLVQSNFGGVLQMDGKPIGKALNQYYLQQHSVKESAKVPVKDNTTSADGSIMIVIATDAPVSDRNLRRLAHRAFAGLARTGASMTNGSGDYAIAFSTSDAVRRTARKRNQLDTFTELPNSLMSPLFQATIEATEEAIYNSMLMAETMSSVDATTGETVTYYELPINKVKQLLIEK